MRDNGIKNTIVYALLFVFTIFIINYIYNYGTYKKVLTENDRYTLVSNHLHTKKDNIIISDLDNNRFKVEVNKKEYTVVFDSDYKKIQKMVEK